MLVQQHIPIKDLLIGHFSCLLKHFGGNAICGCEMELLKTIIMLSQEDNILSIKSSLQLLNSLIEKCTSYDYGIKNDDIER